MFLRPRLPLISFRFGAISGIMRVSRQPTGVEAVIREKIAYLAGAPGGGHWRRDLTDEPVKFFPIYSYLIVYRPETKPLQVVAILNGRRDVEQLLRVRL
jgi:plasmid stabilization system protein ParE